MPRHSGLAVIESRWGFNGQENISVKPLFDLVVDWHTNTHHAYDYEMIGTPEALGESFARLAGLGKIEVIYLGTHGEEGGKRLALHSEKPVTRTRFSNMLKRANGQRGAQVSGVYLGSCYVGTQDWAKFILERDRKIKWVAGYRESVEFVDSTALDLFFFNQWLASRGTPRRRIEHVASAMNDKLGSLCRATDFQFSIYTRQRGGGVVDWIEAPERVEW